MKYTNIISYLVESVWAVVPSVLEHVTRFLTSTASVSSNLPNLPILSNLSNGVDDGFIGGVVGDGGDSEHGVGYLDWFDVEVFSGVAVVKVHGALALRGGIDADCMKVYSYLDFERLMVYLSQDKSVEVVVLDMDSPGGTVSGIKEAVRGIEVYRSSGKKLVVYGSGLVCSAAYWLSAYADAIYVTPSSLVGSIGVYMLHVSSEGHLDKEGYKVTIVEAGSHKTEGTSYRNLPQETVERYRSRVEKIYDEFLGIVVKNRNLRYEDREVWADGRIFEGGEEAFRVGLVDGVMTPVEFRERVLSGLYSLKVQQNKREIKMNEQTFEQKGVAEMSEMMSRISFLESELSERDKSISVLNEKVSVYESRVSELEGKLKALSEANLELRFEAMMRENVGRVNVAQREKFYEMFKKSMSEETLTLIEGLVSVLPDVGSELVQGVSISNPAPLPVPNSVKTLEEKKALIAELANKRVSGKKVNL